MTISESIEAEWARDAAEKAPWTLGEYTGEDCGNCGRQRVCACPNGKTRCEKCNWVAADGEYCPVSL